MNEDGYTSSIKDKILSIDVKPGWKEGTRIIFPKEGDQVKEIYGNILTSVTIVTNSSSSLASDVTWELCFTFILLNTFCLTVRSCGYFDSLDADQNQYDFIQFELVQKGVKRYNFKGDLCSNTVNRIVDVFTRKCIRMRFIMLYPVWLKLAYVVLDEVRMGYFG